MSAFGTPFPRKVPQSLPAQSDEFSAARLGADNCLNNMRNGGGIVWVEKPAGVTNYL